MKIFQKDILLSSKPRGFHLITGELLNNLAEIRELSKGIAHFFIKHTSASLSINENADPSVRSDLEDYFNYAVPENLDFYRHRLEGADDMTSHIKSSILGTGLTVPVTEGRLNLGTWQGIYLCEHRNHGGRRHILVTVFGE